LDGCGYEKGLESHLSFSNEIEKQLSERRNRMKTMAYVTVAVLFVFTGEPAFGNDEIDFEVKADFFSKYIWRGQNLNDDPVFQRHP
jgi:hypothetical protein